jgi:hypothetical protein
MAEIDILSIYDASYSLEVFESELTREQKRNTYWENRQGNLIRLDNIGEKYKQNIIRLLKYAEKRQKVDDFSDALVISEIDYDMYI